MSADSNFLVDAFRRQLAATITPDVVRTSERSGPDARLWQNMDETGFLDALVPETSGGAGLDLAGAFGLILASGEYLVPLPFAETMVARALLTRQGVHPPAGTGIVLAGSGNCIPFGRYATHALLPYAGSVALMQTKVIGPDLFNTGAATALEAGAVIATLDIDPDRILCAAAAIASAQMAGAMGRLLVMTLGYAGDRQQFGRPLGKFQAIQQQLAVLAEQIISAQVAARSAFVGEAFDPVRVAAAKCRCNEAATVACNIAHAVHGAIGVTEEFDLQLYTRRIKQWQLAFGSESYWAGRLGHARIAAASATTADFLRIHLAHGGQ